MDVDHYALAGSCYDWPGSGCLKVEGGSNAMWNLAVRKCWLLVPTIVAKTSWDHFVIRMMITIIMCSHLVGIEYCEIESGFS